MSAAALVFWPSLLRRPRASSASALPVSPPFMFGTCCYYHPPSGGLVTTLVMLTMLMLRLKRGNMTIFMLVSLLAQGRCSKGVRGGGFGHGQCGEAGTASYRNFELAADSSLQITRHAAC